MHCPNCEGRHPTVWCNYFNKKGEQNDEEMAENAYNNSCDCYNGDIDGSNS